MPTLTLEAIRENPWNVITHQLPEHPDWFLLEFALSAADYCRTSEYAVTSAVRCGLYTPANWVDIEDVDDRWAALELLGEIAHDIYRHVYETSCRLFGPR